MEMTGSPIQFRLKRVGLSTKSVFGPLASFWMPEA
jgi:hypothetical protein